eukprot:128069_1
MEALMKEIADAEEYSTSRSPSVVIRDGDDYDINTDDDYSSDRDDKKINNNNKPVGVIGLPRILSNNSAGNNEDLSHSDSSNEDDDQFDGNVAMEALMKEIADAEEN